jgi:AAA15 family ATPase/GTPase
MSLRIKNITIENFKVYEKLDFEVTNDFSIIIGENNIGKTTLFEVLLLWMKCYKSIIIPNKNYKFYHIANSATYVNFSDLYFLRATNDKDIFKDVNSDIKIKLTIFDNLDNREFGLELGMVEGLLILNSKPNSLLSKLSKIVNLIFISLLTSLKISLSLVALKKYKSEKFTYVALLAI